MNSQDIGANPRMETFGTLADGRRVHSVTLRHGSLSARILTLGAILQDLRLDGVDHALTLGSESLAAYEGPMNYFGAVVGPVANRIAGARAQIAGRDCRFEANQDGRHVLHGGPSGPHAQVWTVEEASGDSVTLSLALADGLGGFPGNRRIAAHYALTPDQGLAVTLTADTDAPTLMNLAHHGYWNLDGGATWEGHSLQILAEHVLPTTGECLPTGEIRAVAGTEFDFREPRRLAAGSTPPLDHNFCLARARRPLAPALRLTGQSGLSMEVSTTEPGLQVFTAEPIDCAPHPSHRGAPYGARAGVAIEPQFWPDAPNHPGFPQIALAPGETWRQDSLFRFTRP